MGQGEILEFLRGNLGKWLSTKEISEAIDTSHTTVINCMKKLRESEQVHCRETNETGRRYYYSSKECFPMGQQDVYRFLQEHPGEWFTSKEISERIGLSIGVIAESLRKMRVNDEIEHRGTGCRRNGYQYKFKDIKV